MEASVAWSYELLTDDERRLLDAVSLFASTFTVAAAGYVAGYAGVGRAADVLGRLVTKSLVERFDEGFTLLESIRDYARRQVQQSTVDHGLFRRLAEYYTEWARIRPNRDDATFEQVRREVPNLRQASLAATQLQDWNGAAEILHALNLYWARAGYAPDTRGLVHALLDQSDDLAPRALAIALCVAAALGLGVAVTQASPRRDDAVSSTLRAITAADAADEPWLQLLARSVVAMQLMGADPDAARRYLDEAVDIGVAANLDAGVAAVTMNLGVLDHALQRYPEARDHYREAIEAATLAGMSFTKAITLANIGELEIDAGSPEQALPHLREALILADAHGFVFVAALVTGLIGEAQAATGDPFAAKLIEEAMGRLERLAEGDPSLRGYLTRFRAVVS